MRASAGFQAKSIIKAKDILERAQGFYDLLWLEPLKNRYHL